MKGNSPDSNQPSFLLPSLKEQLDPNHLIYQLNERINWSVIEEDFKKLYSHTGRPAKPVRLMVSLLLLKQLEDLVVRFNFNLWSMWLASKQRRMDTLDHVNINVHLMRPEFFARVERRTSEDKRRTCSPSSWTGKSGGSSFEPKNCGIACVKRWSILQRLTLVFWAVRSKKLRECVCVGGGRGESHF